MATRSTIALEFADGTVQQVYCHWDGYLEHNGAILEQHYKDPFKLQRLIDLGSLSSLGPEIGEAHEFDCPHKYGTPEYEAWTEAKRQVCTFYTRERGEDLSVHTFQNFADYVANHQYEEYEYILRQVDGKAVWFVADHSDRYEKLSEAIERMYTEKEAA